MFEDVSGYGSWDRRWCMLSNNSLSYWKYPEDEYRKSPLGCINLAECSTDKVSLLLRDLCARKYTFELICVKSKDTCEIIDDSIITKSYEKFKFTK
jgi:actin-binding protein anillin